MSCNTRNILKAICCFALVLGQLSAQLGVPRVGFMKDKAGALRPVFGVTGSFYLGEPTEEGILSSAFGRDTGFIKKQSELIVFRNGAAALAVEAPTGPAVFYFDGGKNPQRVYFPEAEQLWTLEGDKFHKDNLALMPPLEERAEGDELVLSGGKRIRMPEQVDSIERISSDWLVARCASGAYVVLFAADEVKIVQIPEVSE